MVNYNTVEGINVAPKVWWTYNVDTGKVISAKVAARYGFSNTHFNSIAKVEYRNNDREWRTKNWRIGIEGGKYVYQYNADNPITEFANSFSTLFYRKNYMKIYERWQGAAYFSRNYGNGFSWNAKMEFQRRMPLQNTTGYNWAAKDVQPITSNLPAELSSYNWTTYNAALIKIGLSYQPGFTYTLYPDFKQPHRSGPPGFLFRI